MVDGRRQKAAHRMPYTWTNPLGGSPGRFKCLPNLSLLEDPILNPASHLPSYPIPQDHPSAPALSTLSHPELTPTHVH